MKKTIEDHITSLAQTMNEQFSKVNSQFARIDSQFVEVHRRIDLQTDEMRQFRQTVMGWNRKLDEKISAHDSAIIELQKAVGQK